MFRRTLWLVLVAALMVAAVAAGIAVAEKDKGNDKNFEYAIALWGDLPYSAVQADPGVPNLIDDMNRSDIQFSVHDGNLKAGNGVTGNPPSSNCDDALYARALGWFNSLEKPAIFTPGDNDWTDCDRPSNGGYNSRERLDHERQLFFSSDRSLGEHTLKQEVQSTPDCLGFTGPTACVENRRWIFHKVMYVTVNIQGSCDNLCDTAPDPAEHATRQAADIAWINAAFAEAGVQKEIAAIMVIGQADPGFDASDGTRAPLRNPRTLAETDSNPDGYQAFLVAFRDDIVAFKKPVVYVHGDSHYFRVDRPMQDSQGRRLENFTRVETFGDNAANGPNDVHWVKALVDPNSRDVFAFQAQIVPGDRVAVPAP